MSASAITGTAMSQRLWKPRPIGTYEVRILRRVLEVGANSPPSPTVLASLEGLVVREEGGGGFEHDSLDFDSARGGGAIIAGAIGLMANDAEVELVLWARDGVITYLELDPFGETRRPIRMPILESIRAYPEHAFAGEETEGDDAAWIRPS